MEKPEHSGPVSEEDEALSSSKKFGLEVNYKEHSEEEMQKLDEFDYKEEKAVECSSVSQDTGEYALFTDSRFKLPHYLSEFAIVEFNANQKAMYEKVNVLETMKSLNVNEVTTYLITFEASLPDDISNNAQTFQTKIIMSILDSGTKIDVKFVRIKVSEFDINEEENSKQKLFEPEEEEDSEVSESDKEDSEVFISDKEDSEASESDEQDSEELFEYDEQDSEELFESDEQDSEELFESDEQDTESKILESDKQDPEQEKLSEFEFDDPKEEELSESDDDELCGNEMKQYHIDVKKSDGFEVGNYPHARTPCCMIRRYYDPPGRIQSTTNLKRLIHLSRLAICFYNMKEDTSFDNVKVLKAMAFGCGITNYNITFEASLSDGVNVTFQTRIYTSAPVPYRNIEIDFVRIKPSIKPEDVTT